MAKAGWKDMLKLIKYELRKNRTALLIVLAILVAVEVYFLGSMAAESDNNVFASLTLMFLGFFAVAFAVFIIGVTAYSGELKRKSSYLIFMTPHGTLAIVASKLLFTLVIGLLFSALVVAMLAVNVPLIAERYGEWRGYYNLFDQILLQQGVDLGQIIAGLVLTILQFFLNILSVVGVAYFSVTLSATILQSRKGRGLLSFLFFALFSYALMYVSGLYVRTEFVNGTTTVYFETLAPAILQSAIVLLASLFGSAWMLKKHVSL